MISQTYSLVVGLGSSGMSMARFLHGKGKQVIVTDIDVSKKEAGKFLNDLGIKTQIGFHDQETFTNADAIIVSPGIPLDNDYIKTAAQKGTPITGELDIFTFYNKTPVIAITGTNGKTTVTTLIRNMLEASGISTFMGGNIGTPLVEYLMEGREVDVIVAEISSFQLDLSKDFKPDIAILLNVAEDHLDRYQDTQDYARSKWGIFKNQTHEDKAVINQAIEGFDTRIDKISSRISGFSSLPDSCFRESSGTGSSFNPEALILEESIQLMTEKGLEEIDTSELKELPGIHNKENIAAASLATLLAKGNINGISQALSKFKNLPHRMAFVREINKISFYNDSKATNVDAVIRALESFKKNIILILGGREKGTKFAQLIPWVTTSVNQIIAIGEAKIHIQNTFKSVCPVTLAESMETAVMVAHEAACAGDVVLLSPACASFDWYENYGARGDDFIAIVNKLANKLTNKNKRKTKLDKGVENG